MIKVYREGGKIRVISPYNPDFVKEARRLAGKWDGAAWNFDARDEDRVREVLRKVYGTDGESRPDRLATIRIRVDAYTPNPFFAFGRLIASRYARDHRVKLGDGVVIVSGDFPKSAGSRRYPELVGSGIGRQPVILEVRDVPDHLLSTEGVEYELIEMYDAAPAEPTASAAPAEPTASAAPAEPTPTASAAPAEPTASAASAAPVMRGVRRL